MERICEKRVMEGLPGVAIEWGAVGDVGLVADIQEDNKELDTCGILQQKITSCIVELENCIIQNRPIVSSMVVAEKNSNTNIDTSSSNILDTVLKIMGKMFISLNLI